MRLETTETPNKNDIDVLRNGLVEYNTRHSPHNYRPLGVFARKDDRIIGGATGASMRNWVHVEYFWVSPESRGKGLGTQILQAVEREARQRERVGIHLDTYTFQALPFYQKNGFEVFGEVEDHPKGGKRFYVKKRLD